MDFDFTFRGESLSQRGYKLCCFNGQTSSEIAVTDSQRNFNLIHMFGGKYQPIAFTSYNEALIMEMDICKYDCPSETVLIIQPNETSEIKRWLSSPIANEFRLSDTAYDGIFWKGSFNVEEIHFCGECVGFHLTFTSVAPFGYRDTVTLEGTVAANGTVAINDTSDEEGYIYPDMSITLQADGDLEIENDFDNRKTVINGCESGEIINLTHLLQASTNKVAHILGNDFNYKFVRINNEYGNTVNNLTFNLPCEYLISYTPVAKVVIA